MTEICKTQIIEGAIPTEEALILYDYLKDSVSWVESIKSRKDRTNGGFTRMGCAIDINEYPDIRKIVNDIISKIKKSANHKDYLIASTYLNFYKDGSWWSPNHTHEKMHSLVISLGTTRNFVLGKKIIEVKNGDAVIFGSAIHGIPKQPEVKDGRISIAVFLVPL